MPSVSLSLTVNDAAEALAFYTNAFGAKETFRMNMPDGTIAHCEFNIGDTKIYMSGESPEWHAYAMPEGTMSSCLICLAVENCDASHEQALKAGATSLFAPTDQFWGIRSCVVKDPFGYRWSMGHMVEKMTDAEIAERAKQLFGGA